jgi:uncharacterized membrane protein YphA (DoxX/SURF4 family)
MNALLWILQAALAFLYLSGGAYKFFKFDELATQISTIPPALWRVLGVIEVAGALLLIVPAATKWMPTLTPMAAGVLAVETLALAALYASQSLKIAPTNPLIWAALMGLLVAFVAYGRYAISPAA